MVATRVLPAYLLVDASASMAPRLHAVERMVGQIVRELTDSPMLGEHVRVGLVAFADDAELVLPLCDLTELRTIPRWRVGGQTRFGPLFMFLARVLERDLRVLRSQDAIVYRPFVFLITDGFAVDPGWPEAYQEFSHRTSARLVVLKFGDHELVFAHPRPVAVVKLADAGDDQALAANLYRVVSEVLHGLVRSVMISRRADGRLEIPLPEGFGLEEPLGESDIW